ncbi:hypothetical protein GJ496_003372 [Pomphorhynchus laevis]|nr:hypothetical protein GJ496_003372 [Pomphorhynchus laevis]
MVNTWIRYADQGNIIHYGMTILINVIDNSYFLDFISNVILTELGFVVISAFMYLLIYRIISPFIFSHYSTVYKDIERRQQKCWDMRITSLASSIILGLSSLILFIKYSFLHWNPIRFDASNVLIRANICLLTGYIFADVLVILLSNESHENVGFIAIYHHILALFGLTYANRWQCVSYMVNIRCVSEISSIFLHLRWFLSIHSVKKTSWLYLLNAALLTISFTCCRITMLPIYWFKLYHIFYSDLIPDSGIEASSQLSIKARYTLICVCFCLDLMNLYWWLKLVRGCVRIASMISSGYRKE